MTCLTACDLSSRVLASQRPSVLLRPRPERVDVSSGPRLSHQGVSHLFRGRHFRQSHAIKIWLVKARCFLWSPLVVFQVMTMIQDLPVPVIAMVNGVATAAGCQLVASCDIAVATEKSTFATPGVNIGLFCSTPAVAIGRAVPRKVRSWVNFGGNSVSAAVILNSCINAVDQVAMEMLFTGTPISAHDALLHGLVSKVVPEERLEAETLAIARRVCEASRPVVALGKATFQRFRLRIPLICHQE